MERLASKKVRFMAAVGIMSAMVFAFSFIRIVIPAPAGNAAVHFGNIMCILSGLFFGALGGGLSSGIGSMFYDFTNPLYIAESPITFATKFAMGFAAGLLSRRLKINNLYVRSVIAAVSGQIVYIALYLLKSFIFDFFLYGNAFETVIATLSVKAVTSAINGVIAVVCAVPLYAVMRNVLVRTPFKNLISE